MLLKAAYAVYFVLAVAVLLEIALRIYNPFQFRIKGDNIVLDVNKSYKVDNSGIPVLDKTITHTKNNLGFRGPNLPSDFDERLSVITIGGSTTECSSISDGETWTDVLHQLLSKQHPRIWVNNAGLAGHSTYGHIALMKDRIVPLQPDYAIFLVGVNDIRRSDLTDSDKSNSATHHKNFLTFLSRKSELSNVIINLLRNRDARRRNLTDTYLDLKNADTLHITDNQINQYLAEEHQFLIDYEARLNSLVSLASAAGISPVLVTQPLLLGEGTDSVTGVNLESVRIGPKKNGRLWWTQLEKYNSVTRNVAARHRLLLIDLAKELPKNSRYFYDAVHFTNEGCKRVGELIFDGLKYSLKKHRHKLYNVPLPKTT